MLRITSMHEYHRRGRAWGPAPSFGVNALHSAQCTALSHNVDNMPPFILLFTCFDDKIYTRSPRDTQTRMTLFGSDQLHQPREAEVAAGAGVCHAAVGNPNLQLYEYIYTGLCVPGALFSAA